LIALLLNASNSIENKSLLAIERLLQEIEAMTATPCPVRPAEVASLVSKFKHGSAREWLVASEQGPPAMKNANDSLHDK